MPKYRVYAIASASWVLGEYEAESKEAAIEMSEQDDDADYYVGLCHQCAGDVELGDAYEFQAEEA
jgi:hypothetical protein